MIVENMTNKEIIDNCKRDWNAFIIPFINRTLGDNKYRRYILKNIGTTQVHYFKPIEFTSKYDNDYIILPNTKGKNDFKKYGLLYTVYMLYKQHGKFHAVLPVGYSSSKQHNMFAIYTSHLFDRYRERGLKDIHINKTDAILDFFKNNPTSMILSLNNPKYVNSIFTTCKNGVLLGTQISKEIVEFKTYISFEMLKGKQTTHKEELEQLLCEYINTVQ